MALPTSLYVQSHSKKGSQVKMNDFMYEDEQTRKQGEHKQFLHFLDSFEPKAK
jgi:hypothetical protein